MTKTALKTDIGRVAYIKDSAKMLKAGAKMLSDYQQAQELADSMVAEAKALREQLKDFVSVNGAIEQDAPETENRQVIVDNHRLYYFESSKPGSFEEIEAIKWVKKTKHKNLVFTQEHIDRSLWNKFKKENKIPKGVLNRTEIPGDPIFKLQISEIKDNQCKGCAGQLKKKDQFCPKCGQERK